VFGTHLARSASTFVSYTPIQRTCVCTVRRKNEYANIYIYTPTVSYLNVSKRQTRFERRTRKRNNTRWGNARPFSIRNSGKIVVARPRRDEHTPTEFGRSAVSASKLAGNDGRRARMDYRISFADSTGRHTGHARRKSARYARFAFVYAYIKSRAPA